MPSGKAESYLSDETLRYKSYRAGQRMTDNK